MTPARGFRQILYTLLLVLALKYYSPWLDEASDAAPDELPRIAIEVSPRLQLATRAGYGRVSIRVTIPKNAQNRAVCVIVDGTIYRSSCYEHVGLGATYREEWAYLDVPVGYYDVTGELQWVDEAKGERKVTLAHDRFEILSPS